MHIASRKHTSHFESSKNELSLKTKTTTTHRTETIKKTLSESGPENVLATKGYTRTRTFTVGQAKRAVLAFSEEKQRVDGFVLNKDQQLVPIKAHDLPKELKAILSSDAFEAFLNDIHARLTQLSNGDFHLEINQGLKGGVYRTDGNIDEIKKELEKISKDSKTGGGRHESRIIIKNECSYSLSLIHKELLHGYVSPDQLAYVVNGNQISSGAASGIFVNSRFGVPFGVEGYFSLKAETQDGNLLVICLFSTAFHVMNDNSAKIIIRPLDDEGNVAGGWITPEGKITDMIHYSSQRMYHSGKPSNTKLFQCYSMLDIHCNFDNNTKACFTFTFKEKKNPVRDVDNSAPKHDEKGDSEELSLEEKSDKLFSHQAELLAKIEKISKQLTAVEKEQNNIKEDFNKKLTAVKEKQNDMEKDFNQKFLTNQKNIEENQKGIADSQRNIERILLVLVPNPIN